MLTSLTRAAQQAWPVERELLATVVELLHVLIIVTMKANGAKRTPKPIRVPRPSLDGAGSNKTPSVRPKEFFARFIK